MNKEIYFPIDVWKIIKEYQVGNREYWRKKMNLSIFKINDYKFQYYSCVIHHKKNLVVKYMIRNDKKETITYTI